MSTTYKPLDWTGRQIGWIKLTKLQQFELLPLS
jgi:hypothetical protein